MNIQFRAATNITAMAPYPAVGISAHLNTGRGAA